MDEFIDLIRFVFLKKKFYFLPIIILVLLIGGIMIASESAYISPFIYSLF